MVEPQAERSTEQDPHGSTESQKAESDPHRDATEQAQLAGRGPRPSVLVAAVGTLAALTFAPSLGGGYIYDDNPLIASNIFIHSFAWWRRWLTSDFWDINEQIKRFGSRLIYWRPAVTASYALDWQLGGGSPVVFHATNLVWHAIASMLAFVLLRRWSGSALAALFGALLFALHPTKAESVAWIAGRTDVLCAVGLFVATVGLGKRLRGEKGGVAWEVAGTLFAYLTKEQAIVLPAFYAVETWVALGRPAVTWRSLVAMAKSALPQALLALGYLAVRAKYLPIRPPGGPPVAMATRVREVLETFGRLGALLFAPHDLSVQQGLLRSENGHTVFSSGYMALGALFIASMFAAAWFARRRWPTATIGIGLFLISIAPTSNVVPTDMKTMLSERFLYVPMLGFCLIAAKLFADATVRTVRAVRIGATTLVTASMVAAGVRSTDFADADAFWARELAMHPYSIEAIEHHVAKSLRERRLASAMTYVARAHEMTVRHFGFLSYDLDFDLQGLQLLAMQIPDRERESLEALERFYDSLLEPKTERASLELHGLSVQVPLDPPPIRLKLNEPRILSSRADVASRLGHDDAAGRSAMAAHLGCLGCEDIGRAAALVHARGGRYAEARAVVDTIAAWLSDEAVAETRQLLDEAERHAARASQSAGAARLQARASELSTLEAWGRAYDVLAPYVDEIKQAPDFALGFAELAWRAGHWEIARAVLGAVMAPERIEPTTTAWSRKMGWVESP